MIILRAYRVASVVATAGFPLAVLAAIATSACKPAPGASSAVAPAAGRETLITEDEIARMSVRTAWDAVRLRTPRLSFSVDATGRPTGVRIQERRSSVVDETPLLVVDGVRMSDIQYLNEIPASEVHAIHVLDAEAAEPRYGLGAAGGAIVVETKRGK
jgi:outer membrane receptor for ferrienterochelin and colicin